MSTVSRRREGFGVDLDEATPVYIISVAAELTGLHPQTLRTYDRLGLVSPGRAGGGGRLYSARDIQMLRRVVQLSAEGIGLEGVRRILELEQQVDSLQDRIAELEGRTRQRAPADPNPFAVERVRPQSTAVVLWRRRRR